MMLIRGVSPSMLGIALVCFFMPFFRLTCGGRELMKFSGINMVTGTEIHVSKTQTETVEPQWQVIAAALLIGAACVAGLASGHKRVGIAAAGAAGLAAALLLVWQSRTDGEVQRAGEGLIHLEWLAGFWITVCSCVGAAFANVIGVATPTAAPPLAPPGPSHPPP